MLSPRIALIIFLLSSLTIASSAQTSTQAAGQSGAKPGAQTAATPGARPGTKPWNGAPQLIPGRVQCEFYDIGGEAWPITTWTVSIMAAAILIPRTAIT